MIDPLVIISKMLQALNGLKIPYMIVGSLSSNLYGEPRLTDDADFVVELGGTSIAALIPALGPEFWVDTQLGFETITGRTRYRISHIESEFLIELFQLTDDPHNQARFGRRREIVLADVPAAVQSAEDVIVQKLRWFKRGDRQKDFDDAKNVIETQAGLLDIEYIRQWADQHETRELLEKILAESTL